MVDLHSHTTASDGTCSPSEVVRRAEEKGLKAVGITDHDTMAGIEEALRESAGRNIEVVPGIEISSLDSGRDIHVLGYYADWKDQRFLAQLESLRNSRDRRNEMLIDNLRKLGIEISLDEVRSRRKMNEGNIGRPHIAEVLIEKGIVSSMKEAFDQYLGENGKAYANPTRISPEEAIREIKRAGGVAVLAHPGLYGDEQDKLVMRLIQDGLDGIEVWHTDHSPEQEDHYRKIAEQCGLIATAGSDFHGERNGVVFHGDLGTRKTAYETVEMLKKRAGR